MSVRRQDHVLIVEDEPRLASVLGDYLTAAGYTHRWVADGAEAIDAFRREQPDLVLLDLMLPGLDGIEICSALLRDSQTPIVMVTARVEEVDRLLGLEIGADDYICKPFSPREVIARIGAVLRRHRHMPAPPAGPITIDEESCRATLRGQPLDLTPVEFRLLRQLHGAQGRVFSRDQLLNGLYNDHRIVTDRAVDSHVKNLRRKIADAGGSEDWIKSIYGVGYRMDC